MYYIDYWHESVELAESERPGSLWVCLAPDPLLSDAVIPWPFCASWQSGVYVRKCGAAPWLFLYFQILQKNDLRFPSGWVSWHFEIGVRCHPQKYPEDSYAGINSSIQLQHIHLRSIGISSVFSALSRPGTTRFIQAVYYSEGAAHKVMDIACMNKGGTQSL